MCFYLVLRFWEILLECKCAAVSATVRKHIRKLQYERVRKTGQWPTCDVAHVDVHRMCSRFSFVCVWSTEALYGSTASKAKLAWQQKTWRGLRRTKARYVAPSRAVARYKTTAITPKYFHYSVVHAYWRWRHTHLFSPSLEAGHTWRLRTMTGQCRLARHSPNWTDRKQKEIKTKLTN